MRIIKELVSLAKDLPTQQKTFILILLINNLAIIAVVYLTR
jgi:hypothetical protein